jgi:hypothetical protein
MGEHFDASKTLPKDYYKAFLNVKESFFNRNVEPKRRNSLDLAREIVSL